MRVCIDFVHPEDELDPQTVAFAMQSGLEEYIKSKGHLSNYDPDEWSIDVYWSDDD